MMVLKEEILIHLVDIANVGFSFQTDFDMLVKTQVYVGTVRDELCMFVLIDEIFLTPKNE